MRTETTVKNIYTWEELTEEQKQKAIENLYGLNVDHDWWDFTYMDAAEIGLEITAFDIYRGNYVKGAFLKSALQVANNILKDHGCDCETAKTAQAYLNARKQLLCDESQAVADLVSWPGDEREWWTIFNYVGEDLDTEDIDNDFLKSLCEDYRIILRNEYKYLTSKKAIIETIIANEYEFYENGEIA